MNSVQVCKKWTPLTLGTVLMIVAVLMLVTYAVTPYHTFSKDLSSGDSSVKSTATLQNHIFFSAQLNAVDDLLINRVYVLNTGEIVAEKPLNVVNTQNSTAQPSASSELKASFTVVATRLIVVNKSGRIIEIWSNTRGTNCAYYSLTVKELSRNGVVHSVTEEIVGQYNQLFDKINWNIIGQVYCVQNRH